MTGATANRARYIDQTRATRTGNLGAGRRTYPEATAQRLAGAVGLLTDLHGLAVRRGKRAKFQMELEKIRQTHAAKEHFLRRLAQAPCR